MQCSLRLALAALALSVGACATQALPCAPTNLAYVGTDGSQIRALRFDACTGKMAMIGPVADVTKPRWTVAHPTLPIVYAAIDGNNVDGSVIAYRVDRGTGGLTKLNEVAAGGSGTTYLWLDAPSMTLLAANFSGGSASSIAIKPDGSLGSLVSTIKATGSGPHRRQASPHAHGATVDPSGRYALVSDMGADRVFVYGFDRTTHALLPDDEANPRSFTAPAGSGPRRSVFGSSGRFVYVLNELSAELMALRWDGQAGRLAPMQSLQTSSAEFKGAKSTSEIALSHDGRFIYVGNRGENTIVVYSVNADSGELALVQRVPSGGEGLWNFDVHPSGQWMLVAHYRSNSVGLFSIDPASGRVSNTGQTIESPAPVSVGFVN